MDGDTITIGGTDYEDLLRDSVMVSSKINGENYLSTAVTYIVF